jgi:hypothetical protein
LRDHAAAKGSHARAHARARPASSVSRLGGELGFVFSLFLILCHDNLDTIADGLNAERRG